MENGVKIIVRFAKPDDFAWCAIKDAEIDREIVRRKIDHNEIFIAEMNGEPVGFLRLQFLWERIPCISLIYVEADRRYQGIGTAILRFLETFLRNRGYKILLSSSMVDEPEPQEWHHKMGFEECGIITGINEGGIGEIFFRKKLI